MSVVRRIIKKEIVLIIAFVLAVLSVAIVPPDSTYLSYIDYRTLAILFSLMLIISGLRRLGVFAQVGESMLSSVRNVRGIALVMSMLCFFLSMLITNDVALITFVPFAIITLNIAGRSEYLIPIIVLETIAANLGSMMTPMGNPQNLYLYGLTSMSLLEFIELMLPYGLVSLAIIVILAILLTSKTEIALIEKRSYRRTERENRRMALYVILFVMEMLVVVRVMDYRAGLLAIIAVVIVFDRRMLIHGVDYSLLATFTCLFIFIGNLKRMPEFSMLLSSVVSGNEIVTAVASSQIISNVPAAILLSAFTDNVPGLIVGTNLGGLGTLIASMASLISFKQYSSTKAANKLRYMSLFTVVNLGMLAVLLLLAALID